MSFRAHGTRAGVAGVGLLLAAGAWAQALNDVVVSPVDDGARVVLQVDGSITHKSFTLTDPDRIVVDLVGASNAVRAEQRSVPSGAVKRVRVSQFATEPQAVTRIVVDLRQAANYEVVREGQNLVLVVTPQESTGVVPDVASRTPRPATPGNVNESVVTGAPAAVTPAVPGAPVQTKPVKASAEAKRQAEQVDTHTVVGSPLVTKPVVPQAAVVGEGRVTSADTAVLGRTPSQPVETQAKLVATQAKPIAPQAKAIAPQAKALETQTKAVETQVGLAKPVQIKPVEVATIAAPFDVKPVDKRVGPPVTPEVPAVGEVHTVEAHAVPVRKVERGSEDASPRPQPIQMQESHGRRVNLDVQGADIQTVLRTLSEYSGRNIIASREVQGEVSVKLQDTPWESALDAILKAHGYGWIEEDGIIRVGNRQKLRSEELEEVAADRKREELSPLETRILRLEFADAAEMQKSLDEMLSGRGKMQVDARTNAIILTDIPPNVAEIETMMRSLDDQTPQVEIISKLIDVSADDSQNLGISWHAKDVVAGDVIGSVGVDAASAGSIGMLKIGSIQSWGQLDGVLDALAQKKRANIVSNPNITTVNNRQARILVGAKIPLITADTAGNAITKLTTIGIQMEVKPHVNSDRTITLDLHTEVSDLSSKATVQGGVIINTSEADTRIIVDNGQTAIIGGLIRDVQSEVKTGVPMLQDIPGVGWLFRNTNTSNDKRELIIFVTPRLVDSANHTVRPKSEG